jgi:5-methylcytosine-specific restriction enzyme subunit McrC
LKRSDFYQLFAYGSIYLRGRDDAKLVLIYPMRAAFDEPLQVFKFSETLELWVLPFDLDAGNLGHLASTNLPLLTKKM